jgi:hypothetical protein
MDTTSETHFLLRRFTLLQIVRCLIDLRVCNWSLYWAVKSGLCPGFCILSSYVQDHRSSHTKILFSCYILLLFLFKKGQICFFAFRLAGPSCLRPEPGVGGPGKKESLFLKQMLQFITPGELKVELKFWTASCCTETMLTELVAYLSAVCCHTMHDIPDSSLSDVSITSASEVCFVCRVVKASEICVPSYAWHLYPYLWKSAVQNSDLMSWVEHVSLCYNSVEERK